MSGDGEYLFRRLSVLVGRRLSAVTFIHDYLQFEFGGPCLTVFNPISVGQGNSSVSRGEAGFRDALYAQIEAIVDSVSICGDVLTIEFESGIQFRVSLADSDYVGPEAISFESEDGPLLVG